jgi:hypothetical protein
VGEEPLAELRDPASIQGESDRSGVAPETLEHVRGRGDRAVEIHGPDRTPGASGLTIFDRQEQHRNAEALHETGRHDTLDPLVPALAREDQSSIALLVLPLRKRESSPRQVLLHRLPGAIVHVQLARKRIGPHRIVGHQQLKRDRRLCHATRCVQARCELVRYRIGVDALQLRRCHRSEGGDACPRCLPYARETICYKSAVLAEQRHDIGDRSEHRKVCELAPLVCSAEQPSDGLDELQSHPCAGEVARRARRLQLGIGHRNAGRDALSRLMVIGDDYLYAGFREFCHLGCRRDSAVNGDDQLRSHLCKAPNGRGCKTVALPEPVRDGCRHVRAERLESPRGKRRGGDAVQVEVAEHHDTPARTDGGRNPFCGSGHAGNEGGIEPVTFHIRLKEAPGGLGRRDPTPQEYPGDDR